MQFYTLVIDYRGREEVSTIYALVIELCVVIVVSNIFIKTLLVFNHR